MNKLCGMRVYLAGPIDRAPDEGRGWRDNLKPWLVDNGVIIVDPLDKPIEEGKEDTETRERINQLKTEEKYDEVANYKHIRSIDLRAVDNTDFIIVHLDLDIHPCGTMEETFWANREKKPVLVHIEQGKSNCPNWLFWTLPHQHIFGRWEELVGYLEKINNGDLSEIDKKRWTFFDLKKPTLAAMLKAAEHDNELSDMISEFVIRKINYIHSV